MMGAVSGDDLALFTYIPDQSESPLPNLEQAVKGIDLSVNGAHVF